jgi:phospholipase/lecithinase/hemolysin
VVFGDGLSDQGRFYALTDGRYPPSPPFLRGRWTNGPTWVEHLGRLAGLPLAQEDNFAQGGATTGAFNINEPLRGALGLDGGAPIRGVLAQVDAYVARERSIDDRALHVLWAGGHDIGAYLDFGQPDVKAQPPAENVRRAVDTLAKAGARRFFIGNMPDMSSTPGYAGTPKAAKAKEIVDAYNADLVRVAAELRGALGVDLIECDGAAAFADIAAHAGEHGITHLAEAFLPWDAIDFAAPLSAPTPLPKDREGQNPDDYFSFWAVSAGRRVHALLAEKALTTLLTHAKVAQ